MCDEFALPGTSHTISMESIPDPSSPSTSATDEHHQYINSDPTRVVGALEEEPDIARNKRIWFKDLFKMLKDKQLQRFEDSNSGSEGSV